MLKIDTEIVCSSKIDGETLVVHLDTGFYYTLDELGGLIWEGLLNQQSKVQIIETIIDAYDVDKAQAQKDYDELMVLFEKENLVHITGKERAL